VIPEKAALSIFEKRRRPLSFSLSIRKGKGKGRGISPLYNNLIYLLGRGRREGRREGTVLFWSFGLGSNGRGKERKDGKKKQGVCALVPQSAHFEKGKKKERGGVAQMFRCQFSS